MRDPDCRFCEIVATPPAESRWVRRYAGDVVSFKPFGALHPGHRLFVPTAHVVESGDHPIITALAFFWAAKHAAEQDGEPHNLIVNSGEEADQTVFHLHVHYLPREADDGRLVWSAGSAVAL